MNVDIEDVIRYQAMVIEAQAMEINALKAYMLKQDKIALEYTKTANMLYAKAKAQEVTMEYSENMEI